MTDTPLGPTPQQVVSLKNAIQEAPGLTDAQKIGLQRLAVFSYVASRHGLASRLGQQFAGKRDVYEILGYNKDPGVEDYRAKYYRQDIAGRVVDLPPLDTWRKPPIIKDGEWGEAQEQLALEGKQPKHTAFLKAWQTLTQRRRVWHYLERADRLSGIGRFGLLLIGFSLNDGEMLKTPLDSHRKFGGLDDLLYLSAYAENSVTVGSLEGDYRKPNFGKPKNYIIQLGEGSTSATVHPSRVIHIAEDLLEDEVYGRPRLERVHNLLDDLLKIVGGGAEATWQTMDRGLHLDVEPDMAFSESDPVWDKMAEQVDNYIHGLSRVIRTRGGSITPLGGQVVDPSGLFGIIISLVAAASGIPQRILIGSERGELASSQDGMNWGAAITSRRTKFAEPVILRPFIDKLVRVGVLPLPEVGAWNYEVEWPSPFELNALEEASRKNTEANTQKTLFDAGQVPIVKRWREMGYSEQDIARMLKDQMLAETFGLGGSGGAVPPGGGH